VAEIQDSDLLRILRESPVVTPEEVRSAQALQAVELGRQGSCRTLFAILCERGLIDERAARTLSPVRVAPGEVTPHTPTVVLPPPDETPSPLDTPPPDGRRGGSSSSIAGIRSARRRPPEVEALVSNPKNLLGPYILVKEVGKGGMGRVYRAWDENVGRFVALKVIDTEDQADRERFVREAQIAGRLHHSSIATVFHAGEEESRGYIAMQFIDGGPIDPAKLNLLGILGLIRDAAQALSYAHEQGVVHRDVKPGNLMVDTRGRVFLTDFGLAKEVVANDGTQLSITGTTFGTPQYMSPEQARGEHKKIDGRSDVYSLGATLYMLLARRPPFTSTNLATLLLEVLDKVPPPLSRFNKEISPELQMLVERTMAKDPSRRFPTMTAFAVALDRMIREGRYAGRYGMAKALARRWVPRLAIAAALGVAGWFGVPVLLAPSKPAPLPEADPAPQLLAGAAGALRTLEDQSLAPPERRKRIEEQVLQPLAELLRRRPGELRAKAARARALYAQGERDAAAKELAALEDRKAEDYRLPLTAALLALEGALAEPCPLPALEGPGFEWERPPAPWPSALLAEIDAVVRAKVASELSPEYTQDRALIDGLAALAAGQHGKAADALRQKALPVYQAAWCREAYLDRRFEELAKAPESEGRRERFGARLARALGSAAELEGLLPEAGAEAPLLHAALARTEGAGAVEAHADAGLPGAAPERQAALISARLESQALRWADDEKEYRRGLELAGAEPSTWQGRLAAIELRLGLGSRLLRSRGPGRPLLEEALGRAQELAKRAPGWLPPRLLAASANLRLGQLEEARADLSKLSVELRGSARACLLAAALERATAEQERKAGGAWAESAKAAQREALRAPGDPVEALPLLGSVLLLLGQRAAEEGKKEEGEYYRESEAALTRALERVPGYVEARVLRGWACWWRGELARRAGGDGRAEDERARADADLLLASHPGHEEARYLRAIVNYSLAKDADALADWRVLLKANAAWDTPTLRTWMQQAEERLKQK
jgi:hypothetical protein